LEGRLAREPSPGNEAQEVDFMPIEIRQCIVTPGTNGDIVQLHISDAPLGDAAASVALHVTATVPFREAPLLLQLQRETMEVARETLGAIEQKIAREIANAGHGLEPRRLHKR
jgi:hypothetical protein